MVVWLIFGCRRAFWFIWLFEFGVSGLGLDRLDWVVIPEVLEERLPVESIWYCLTVLG